MFRLQKYLFFEVLPAFVLGLCLFIFILVMFQFLRLAEFFLVHQISIAAVLNILNSIILSLLPVILPMATLFATLFAYGRASQDSELVVFQALGYNRMAILLPSLILGALATLASLYCFFYLAPSGHRLAQKQVHELGQTKAIAALKPGTFAEGFFDLVIYATEVDSKTNRLGKVFIYDERDPESPFVVVAEQGRLIPLRTQGLVGTILELENGKIHRSIEGQTSHTSVSFDEFVVQLSSTYSISPRSASLTSMSTAELRRQAFEPQISENQHRSLLARIEFYKRGAIGFAPLIFAFLASVLALTSNRRQPPKGFAFTILIVLAYWIIYLTLEGIARKELIPALMAVWLPNVLFLSFGFWKLLRKI